MYPEIFSTLGGKDFLSAFCEKRPVRFEEGAGSRFEHLLTWDALNTLLSLNLFDEKRMRVVKDGRDLPAQFYRRDSERRSIDAAKLTDLLNQGASLAINSVQFLSPDVRRIAGQLERWLDQKVNVNGYISFGTGGAFSSHFDAHDVLVLQVYGEKDWTVFTEPEPYPVDGHAVKKRNAAKGRPSLMEFTLRAGEMLYVPRGYFHQAAVKDSTSVHLTFGILSAVGIDFVDRLRKRCLDVEEFRQDILGVGGPEALAVTEQRMKARLHQMIDEYSFESFLDERRHKRDTVDFFQLGPKKPASEDPVLAPLVRKRGGHTLPAKADAQIAERVLERLIDHNSMGLGDLCDSFDGEIDAQDVRSTVEQLMDDRLVEIIQ